MKKSSVIKERQESSEQLDNIVITANHVVRVIIVNNDVIKCMGVLLKMRDVKVCCGLITAKVTGAAVKPGFGTGSR